MTIETRNRYRSVSHPTALFRDIVLPRRRPRGDPANIKRIHVASAVNHQWKVARMDRQERHAHERGCPLCAVKIRWRF